MEAWKLVDYTSLSPVYALSITAERWGLEPFPGNLVATTGYLQDNTVDSVWTLPYSCSSSDSSFLYNNNYHNTSDDWAVHDYNDNYDKVKDNSGSYTICSDPQPCADSGCVILIEGIGKTTTGPADSDIVGLSHGISWLLIIAITIAVTITLIMGCGASKLFDPSPPLPPARVQLAPKLRPHFNPPPQQPQRVQTYAERAATAANTAKEVARCSELLRQMYALDLDIWGKEDCVADEIPEREGMKSKANAIFAEINRIVHEWSSRADGKWLKEERLHIEEICKLVDQHDVRRYKT